MQAAEVFEITGTVATRAYAIVRREFRRSPAASEPIQKLADDETGRLVRALIACEEEFAIDLDVDEALAAHDVRGLIQLVAAKVEERRSGPVRLPSGRWAGGGELIQLRHYRRAGRLL